MKTQEISTEALLACAKRELALRRRVYPRLVAQEKMREQTAAHEIACMERIVEILDKLGGALL
jgi:hypothetical protein